MKAAAACAAILFLSTGARALDPVCAVDDPFTMPGAGGTAETVFAWPGGEYVMRGAFAAAAWSVPFGISELAVGSATAGYRRGALALTAICNSTGFDLYGEDSEKIGMALMPSGTISVGLRLTRQAMRIEGFGQADAWSADAGAVVSLPGAVTLSAAVEDIAGAELGRSHEPVDGRLRAGAVWDSGPVRVVAGVSMVRRFDTAFEGGFVADVYEALTIGAAGGSGPDRFTAICSLHVAGMSFSYRGGWHPELGMTHGFSIAYAGDAPAAAPAPVSPPQARP